MLDPNTYPLDIAVKLVMCVVCGTIIGFERQIRGKPAGIRTSCLICISTMLFIYLGQHVSLTHDDHVRVLAQIVSGVGFLGTGVILTRDGLLHGVTSASIIWVLAALGSAVGFGYYAMSAFISITMVLLLVGVEMLEKAFKSLKRGVHRK